MSHVEPATVTPSIRDRVRRIINEEDKMYRRMMMARLLLEMQHVEPDVDELAEIAHDLLDDVS